MKQNIKRMLKRVIKEEVRKVKRLNEQEDLSFEGIADWIRTNIEDAENFSDDQIGMILIDAARGMKGSELEGEVGAAIQQARDNTDEDTGFDEFDRAYPAWGKAQDIAEDIADLADRVSDALFR